MGAGLMGRCGPAVVDEVAGLCLNGHLLLIARGTKPTPCHSVTIRKSPARVWPPLFYVETCPGDEVCAQLPTAYVTAGWFYLGECPEQVTVYGAGGPVDVDVTIVKSKDEARKTLAKFDLEGDDIPIPFHLVTATEAATTAVGYSRVSFEEAHEQAVSSLPLDRPPHPDALATVVVREHGSLHGGFVGFDHFYVLAELSWG